VNKLLKIVQGPNAGAEIVLAGGMTLSLGKGDTCDILLADMSLGDVACELEVNEERVRLLLPGGAEERLEPFHVKFLGETTAFAIGPVDGVWEELVWPARGAAAAEPSQDRSEEAPETPAQSAPDANAGRRRGRGCGCFLAIMLLLILAVLASAVLFCPAASDWLDRRGVPVEKAKSALLPVKGMCKEGLSRLLDLAKSRVKGQKPALPAAPAPDVGVLARGLGLVCAETNDALVVSGNFATRAKRLAATASLYAAKPGVKLDLSDDESLRAATAEVLDLVSEGKLKVSSAANRRVAISGFSPSATDLRTAIEAICADVPYVRNVDCSRVRLGDATGAMKAIEPSAAGQPRNGAKAVKVSRTRSEPRKSALPKMPVVGVTTQPYPCLVLKDGSRVTEGAEFGGFIIEKIGADTIRIRGPEGVFEWKP
jgi:hypothetical protein